MKRALCVLAVVMVCVVAVSLPAWAAYEFYGTKWLEKMSSNPQIAQSGVLSKIKPLTLNFSSQLGALLLGDNQRFNWGDLVNGAMNKGADIYNIKAFDMFLGKGADQACQQFLQEWNFGGLQLSAETQNKINNLTRSHFAQVGSLLTGVSSSRGIIGDSGFPKVEKLTNQVDIKQGGIEIDSSDYKIR